jgi:histidinol-phosphate aminotransferase
MIKLNRPGKEIFEGLLKQGIFIRSGHLLGYENTIRVSIGSQQENEEFIQALRKILV